MRKRTLLAPVMLALSIAASASLPAQQAPAAATAKPGQAGARRRDVARRLRGAGRFIARPSSSTVNASSASRPAAEMTIPPDYTVVDTSGRTMMPGMIELHAHLIILGHGDYGTLVPVDRQTGRLEDADARDGDVGEAAAHRRHHIGCGSGGAAEPSLSVRDRIDKGEIPGPRMSMSGPWITRSCRRHDRSVRRHRHHVARRRLRPRSTSWSRPAST